MRHILAAGSQPLPSVSVDEKVHPGGGLEETQPSLSLNFGKADLGRELPERPPLPFADLDQFYLFIF